MPRRPPCPCPLPASPMIEQAEIRPGYAVSRVIRGNWQLAGGHGAVSQEQALDILGGGVRRRTDDLRLRRHLHRGRGPDRRLPGAARRTPRSRGGARPQGAHEARPRPRPPRRDLEIHRRKHRRRIVAPIAPGAARPRAVPLVGHRGSGRGRHDGLARRDPPGRQDPLPRGHQFRHRAHARHPRRRRTAGLDADAIFPARRPSRERPGGPLRRQ